MSRLPAPQKTMAFTLVLLLVVLFTQVTSAASFPPKKDKYQIELPFACPDTCGDWCDRCPGDRSKLVDFQGDDVFLPILNDTTKPEKRGETQGRLLSLLSASNSHPQPLVSRRQNNDDLTAFGTISTAESWGAGPDDWWQKMNDLIDKNGLIYDYTPRSTAYLWHFDSDEFGTPLRNPKGAAGGSPPVRGSTIFVGASDLGVFVAHIWESPTFVAVKRNETGWAVSFDTGLQEFTYDSQVLKFIQDGTQNFHKASSTDSTYKDAPNSPCIADLVKPGMMLDPKMTEWRQFRLFHPYNDNRGPPGIALKNEVVMNYLRQDLAAMLEVDESDIVRHAPLYEPHMATDGSHKPDPWFNTFTWQYGPTVPGTGGRPAKRGFRATFNGDEIDVMTRVWDADPVDASKYCRLHIKATPNLNTNGDKDSITMRTKVYHPGDRLAFDTTKHRAWVFKPDRKPKDPKPDEVVVTKKETGLAENITITFTGGGNDVADHLDKQPRYDYYHPMIDFGNGANYVYDGEHTERGKKTIPMCRGGSWKRWGPNAVWDRETSCLFDCEVLEEVEPDKVFEPEPSGVN